MQPYNPNSAVPVIDISHYNTVNWDAMKAANQVAALIVKASEGATVQDPMYAAHVNNAKHHGYPVAAYHFARPNQTSAASEATNFIKQITPTKPTLNIVWLDLEASCGGMTPDQVADWVLAFESAVTTATGFKVGLYSDIDFIQNQYNGFNGRLSHMPLWIADYVADMSSTIIPDMGGWVNWVMWQHTSSASIAGVDGGVDHSDAVSLEAIGYVEPKPVVPLLSVEDATEIINRWIGHEYDLAVDSDKAERHRLANALRVAAGQPTT